MDQELLVGEKKEEGEALLAKLVADGFDVTIAFWAKMSDGGLWYLYIATRSRDSLTSAGAWRVLSEALQQVRPRSITISDIKLIHPTDPAAIEAIDAVGGGGSVLATQYLKPLLGDLAIDDSYIYPQQTGPINSKGVVSRLAGKLAETEPSAPLLFVFKDGSRIYANPVGLQRTRDGVDVTLHDVETGTDRSISADDVAAIQSGYRVPRLMKVVREQGTKQPQ